jgi:hypothetical protein
MQLSIDRASGRRRWSSVVGGIDCAYQLRGIVSLGIESGHFFEGGAGSRPSGIIRERTSDKLEGLGDKLLTVFRHCELVSKGIDLGKEGRFV